MNIYVDPQHGNDESSGTSQETAKKTIWEATRISATGDVIYVYEEKHPMTIKFVSHKEK